MASPATASNTPETRTTVELYQMESSTCYYGRRYAQCSCASRKALFTIAGIVGVIILTLGLLALAGYLAPDMGGTVTTALNQINHVTLNFAAKLSTDVLTVALFGIGAGFALTLCGVAGISAEKCKELATRHQSPIQDHDS